MGSLSDTYIPIGTAADTIGNFTPAYVENQNIIIGVTPASITTAADANTAYGHEAFKSVTTGDYNIAIGQDAMSASTTASNNIAIGNSALNAVLDTNSYRNIAIGQNALGAFGGSGIVSRESIAIGSGASSSIVTGARNVAIGAQAMQNDWNNAYDNILIGYKAGYEGGDGAGNVVVGSYAVGMDTATPANWARNVVLGFEAGYSGSEDGFTDNVTIGYRAGKGGTNNYYNVLIGKEAGVAIAGGQSNVFIGHKAGFDLAVNKCIIIGDQAASGASSASKSIAIGHQAANAGLGNYVTILGAEAAQAGADEAVVIGYQAGKGVFSGKERCYRLSCEYRH